MWESDIRPVFSSRLKVLKDKEGIERPQIRRRAHRGPKALSDGFSEKSTRTVPTQRGLGIRACSYQI